MRIRLSFLGDILCKAPETSYASIGNDQYDYSDSFDVSIKNYLSHSHYTVGNLETPLAGKECNYSNTTSVFNTPAQFAACLQGIGINMLTTANNHALDRGIYGLCKTIDHLDALGLDHVGTRKSPLDEKYVVKEINGVRISFLSYTYGMNTEWLNNPLYPDEEFHINFFRKHNPTNYFFNNNSSSYTKSLRRLIKSLVPPIFIKDKRNDWVDCGELIDIQDLSNASLQEDMYSSIKTAKQISDITIMCLHIGGQYNNSIGDYTKVIVDKCIEAGSDLVICNHPHCVLPSYFNHSRFVAYSLGNFYNTPHFGFYVDNVFSDYSIILSVEIDSVTHVISDIYFTVVKCLRFGIHTRAYIVSDLYESLSDIVDKQKLKSDVMNVIERFTNKRLDSKKFIIQKEYNYKNIEQYL